MATYLFPVEMKTPPNVNRLLCISLRPGNNAHFREVNGVLHLLCKGAKREHYTGVSLIIVYVDFYMVWKTSVYYYYEVNLYLFCCFFSQSMIHPQIVKSFT